MAIYPNALLSLRRRREQFSRMFSRASTSNDAVLRNPSHPSFAAEARRQSMLIAQSPQEAEDVAFVDSLNERID